jgi:hypothetical protein
VESLIAEERAKKHDVLAERLAEELGKNGVSFTERVPKLLNGAPADLCLESPMPFVKCLAVADEFAGDDFEDAGEAEALHLEGVAVSEAGEGGVGGDRQ